jgi:acetyltransferase
MWEYRRRLNWLAETNALDASRTAPAQPPAAACDVIARAAAANRSLLSETEAKNVLNAWGIPVVETFFAATEDEAVELAGTIGYPVVVKLQSPTITHKSDVGGVRLNLSSADAVRSAWRAIAAAVARPDFGGVSVQRMVPPQGWELILGATVDPQFGPVLLFGAGGTLVEVMHDRALVIPPLSRDVAYRWMEETRIFRALQGVRGHAPADLEALADTLVRFGDLVLAHREIIEADINPLVASAQGVMALDARLIIRTAADAGPVVPAPVGTGATRS